MNRRSSDMPMQKNIKEELKNNKMLAECAEQFGLVGNQTRMKICWLLCRHPELTVGKIAEFLGVSHSLVSHSFKKLKENKLVNSRREQKHIYYSLLNTSFNRLLKKTLINI